MEHAVITGKALEELRRQRVSAVSAEPRYLQAARAIGSVLDLYTAAREVPLPPEIEMAAALGIGRATLRQALSHLTQEGRLHTTRGVGTFIAPLVLSRPAHLNSLYDDLRQQGMKPSTRVLHIGTCTATPEDAADLHIPEQTQLLHLRRVRYASDKPVAVIDNLLALAGPALPSATELEQAGLYETLRNRYGIELAVASLRVRARLATEEEHSLLRLPDPCAVLVARRLTFDTAGRGVEIGTTVYAEGAQIDGIRLQKF